MRQQLREGRLMDEGAADVEHAVDLAKGELWPIDVVAGSEVDDHVELAIVEGKVAHVGDVQLRAGVERSDAALRDIDQTRLDVDPDESSGGAQLRDPWQRDSAPASDFEN